MSASSSSFRKHVKTLTIDFIIIVVLSGAWYQFIYTPKIQLEKRIKPLVEAGFDREDAVAFDEAYRDWSPFNKSVIEYAQFLFAHPETSSSLLSITGSLSMTLTSLRCVQPWIENGTVTDEQTSEFIQAHLQLVEEDGINSTDISYMIGLWRLSPEFADLLLKASSSLNTTVGLFHNLNALNPEFVEWLFSENPYFYGYLEDGELDYYEKSILFEAASLVELAPFLMRMPEVYTKETNLTEVMEYIDLVKEVKVKDSGAAQWILETGLFMEDKEISDIEQKFVNESLTKPDLLRVYVSKFVMDGIQQPIPRKSINVDGIPDDWEGIQPLLIDEQGDLEIATDLGSDIKSVYVSKDANNLYVMVQYHDRANASNLIDIYFNQESGHPSPHIMFGNEKYVSWWQEWIEKGVQVGYGEVREIAVPLSLLYEMFENASKIYITPIVFMPSIDEWDDSVNWSEINIIGDFDRLEELNPITTSDFGYLTDDLFDLMEVSGNVSNSDMLILIQIEMIINASNRDYQLRKGIYLIDEYGVPNPELFSFKIPSYNTQLQILYWLTQEREIPSEYYRVALALALNYGSVITIGNIEVAAAVKEYVSQIFGYIIETEKIITEYGANWRVKDYPLEADIGLVWGSSGNFYPSIKDISEFDVQPSWYSILNKERRPMQMWEFQFFFTEINTFREMQKFMVNNIFEFNQTSKINLEFEKQLIKYLFCYKKSDRIPGYLHYYISFNHFEGREGDQFESVDGKLVKDNGISNIDWQWRHFNKTGNIIGHCVDNAQVCSALLKSINLPSIMGGWGDMYDGHSIALYYDPIRLVWKSNLFEIIPRESTSEYSYPFGYHIIPCMNWVEWYIKSQGVGWHHDRTYPIHSFQRTIFNNGIPLCYIYKKEKIS